ncbi:hypothetical protein BJY01DRAFT_164068 [Aspergillus pseudoustus]|uniref:Uncharacterized protein n=1 Tax=Aspergillus pseudoustus TaxID=1810923 RepID=A0ABR4IAG2_9EURO
MKAQRPSARDVKVHRPDFQTQVISSTRPALRKSLASGNPMDLNIQLRRSTDGTQRETENTSAATHLNTSPPNLMESVPRRAPTEKFQLVPVSKMGQLPELSLCSLAAQLIAFRQAVIEGRHVGREPETTSVFGCSFLYIYSSSWINVNGA